MRTVDTETVSSHLNREQLELANQDGACCKKSECSPQSRVFANTSEDDGR